MLSGVYGPPGCCGFLSGDGGRGGQGGHLGVGSDGYGGCEGGGVQLQLKVVEDVGDLAAKEDGQLGAEVL